MSSEPTLPITDTLDVLRAHLQDPELLKKIAADLLATQKENAKAKAEDKEAAGAGKNKYRLTVLIRGDASLKALVAGGAYVLAVPDGDESLIETYSGEGLLQRLSKVIRTFNDAPKAKVGRKRGKIKTFVEAMRMLKPKAIREGESAFKIKSADPVEVIVVEKEEV